MARFCAAIGQPAATHKDLSAKDLRRFLVCFHSLHMRGFFARPVYDGFA
jgi:hypothetical protein